LAGDDEAAAAEAVLDAVAVLRTRRGDARRIHEPWHLGNP
jgi:hypothetical protein